MNTTPILLIPFERNTGYDTGVISGALVTIGSDLGPVELSNGQKVNILLLLVLGGFCLTYHHSPTSFIIIGIYHFCDHIGCFIGRSCCWRSFRSDWTTACSGYSGYYIYWRGYWSSSLPYGMEHGPSNFFSFFCNYLPIVQQSSMGTRLVDDFWLASGLVWLHALHPCISKNCLPPVSVEGWLF